MRVLLVGPPGSGKGTQAYLLSTRRSLPHIATGDLLRAAMKEGTPLGERARPFVEVGQLVPDELVNEMIAEHFRQNPTRTFVMDGYPRTVSQAQTFDAHLKAQGLGITSVVRLVVADDEILRRLSGRRSCPNSRCKATYHVEYGPPKVADVCDRCGARLIHRDDDKEETVKHRLQVFHRNTELLVGHYEKQGLVHEVVGEGGKENVYEQIVAAIGTSPQASESC